MSRTCDLLTTPLPQSERNVVILLLRSQFLLIKASANSKAILLGAEKGLNSIVFENVMTSLNFGIQFLIFFLSCFCLICIPMSSVDTCGVQKFEILLDLGAGWA